MEARGARLGSWSRAAAVALFAIVVAAHLVRLDAPLLWEDEADTGDFARSVLAHGVPRAVLGANVLAYGDCLQLSASFLSKRLPWLQYYVGAASLSVFGDSTAGLRALFALAAASSFWPLRAMLRGRSRAPSVLAALALLAPQAALFGRSARYYPLVFALGSAWLWACLDEPPVRRRRAALLAAIAAAMFHAHPVAAAGVCAPTVIWAALVRRERAAPIALATACGLVAWGAWYLALAPIASSTETFGALLASDPAAWARGVLRGLTAGALDLDYVGALPLFALAAVVVACARASADTRRELARGPAGWALVALPLQVASGALVAGVETARDVAVLRYFPFAAVVGPLALLWAAERLATSARAWAAAPLLLATNATTLAAWARPLDRDPPPASWWPRVYGEIVAAPSDGAERIFARLAAVEPRSGATLAVIPPWLTDVVVFYAGARWAVIPDLAPGSACARRAVEVAGEDVALRARRAPDVVVALGRAPAPPGYEASTVLVRRTPFDGGRPELTRRRPIGAEDVPVTIFARAAPSAPRE